MSRPVAHPTEHPGHHVDRHTGYDPRIVLGIGVMDRGFVWAMQKDGFTEKEIAATIALQRELLKSHGKLKDEDRKMAVARKAWDRRREWKG